MNSPTAGQRAVDRLRERGLGDVVADIARGLHLTQDELLRERWPLAAQGRRSLYAYLRGLGWSYPQIGKVCGRDHSTVMAALECRS